MIQESADSGRYLADRATAGPWDPGLQHGGPPNALLVRTAERAAAAGSARSDLTACRLAAEFVGPVPVGEVSTAARIVRSARSGVLVEVSLSSGDGECLHGRVWLIRDADTTEVAAALGPLAGPPDATPAFSLSFPFSDSIDWHEVRGSIVVPGPGAVWARPRCPLVPGEELSGLQRVALIGDSASGISSELNWTAWSFLNVDLDVHLARPFVGDWLYLDAATQVGTHGAALARSTVSDRHGPVATTAQTLVVAPRRR
ncbi:MAG: thioesterase family protein [Jatrophihabitantaceae bacterium]